MSNNNRFSPPLFFKLIPLRRRWGRCNAFFANNAITSVTHKIHDETYTYDSEGNRVSKQNSTHRELYEWDYRNRLTKVIQQEYNSTTEEWQNVQIVEYAYDYNNIWIRKTLDTNGDGTADSKSIFIPENYQTTVQLDNNTVSHHYLWIPQYQDKLLADTTTDGVLWSLTDHLGTVRDIIGTTNTHLIYDAFGNLVSGTNPILFGYTGKAFDTDTQLQNNINHWYDPALGRWLSIDPIGFEGNDTNLYRYICNNSILFIDSSGNMKSLKDRIPYCKLAEKCNKSVNEILAELNRIENAINQVWVFPFWTQCCEAWVREFDKFYGLPTPGIITSVSLKLFYSSAEK